ncbi:uncharacterized protein NEMAJ01_0736 [Nematocida major]|uniref:uncharacterized protein n=1 Tax=Nematocida major TaxID=1912982 RepID=UPI00200724E3|nr:uncharacterized protein NEMAJ01_0736 [Nematocida major]KAH9385840.1 hypothetical protein NEMAJ01_0736 [Nematocida major]
MRKEVAKKKKVTLGLAQARYRLHSTSGWKAVDDNIYSLQGKTRDEIYKDILAFVCIYTVIAVIVLINICFGYIYPSISMLIITGVGIMKSCTLEPPEGSTILRTAYILLLNAFAVFMRRSFWWFWWIYYTIVILRILTNEYVETTRGDLVSLFFMTAAACILWRLDVFYAYALNTHGLYFGIQLLIYLFIKLNWGLFSYLFDDDICPYWSTIDVDAIPKPGEDVVFVGGDLERLIYESYPDEESVSTFKHYFVKTDLRIYAMYTVSALIGVTVFYIFILTHPDLQFARFDLSELYKRATAWKEFLYS